MSPQQACTHSVRGARSKVELRLRYLLYLPPGYGADPSRGWPLVLFLHGAGERGDDLDLVRRHGVPRRVEEEDFPFVAVSPQCAAGASWHRQLPALKSLLEEVLACHTIDPDRVYLTGISMGGYGAWHLAARFPQLFAAVVPVCGGGLPSAGFPEKVCALRDVPVWAFHGAEDLVVPVQETTQLVEKLRACGGDVRLTIYPGVGHDSWTRTYAEPQLYAWLLAQRRGQHHQR